MENVKNSQVNIHWVFLCIFASPPPQEQLNSRFDVDVALESDEPATNRHEIRLLHATAPPDRRTERDGER